MEIEIPKQTWLMLRKPCRLQTDGRMDRRTDKVNPVYPPSNFVGRGYNNMALCTSMSLPPDGVFIRTLRIVGRAEHIYQSGTKPNLVAKILATNFGVFL